MTKFRTFIINSNDEVKIIDSDDKLADENFDKNKKTNNFFKNPKNKVLNSNLSSVEKETFSSNSENIINKINIKKENFMCNNSTYRTYIIEQGENGEQCSVDNFDIDMASENITYVGYGIPESCKILKIETVSGCTYTSLWAEGDETLNKIWDNRETYSYF